MEEEFRPRGADDPSASIVLCSATLSGCGGDVLFFLPCGAATRAERQSRGNLRLTYSTVRRRVGRSIAIRSTNHGRSNPIQHHWLVAIGGTQVREALAPGRVTLAKAGVDTNPCFPQVEYGNASDTGLTPTQRSVLATMSVHPTHHCPLSQQRGQVNCRQRGPSMRRFRRGYARHRCWTQDRGSGRHDAEQRCMLVADVKRLLVPTRQYTSDGPDIY